MKRNGTISRVENEMAYGTVYNDEGDPSAFSFPVPSGWSGFSIIPESEVVLIDGEEAMQEDGEVTPVFIIFRRDKALVLVTRETETGLDVISGNIMDKEAVKV